MSVIVRMPPSPTGHLHLGTARTGLFNYLFAKAHNGQIVFRWEDTDQERSKTEYETEILDGLKWLGTDFVKESSRIVRQTDSLNRHQEVLKNLWEQGKVFPCFTSTNKLDQLREDAQKSKQNFVFLSPFRDWNKDKLTAEMQTGKPFAWRLRCPENQDLSFTDQIRGQNIVNSNTLGDIVIARQDGSVLYLLANVIDDHDQGITHVIRGEDHIANTPKQLLCWQALGQTPPQYAHIPLVLDTQKRKLSKRRMEPDVAVLIKDFQAQGFLPQAVTNGLAFLGWNPKSTEEIFTLTQLEKIFDLAGVNAGSAQYDFDKMRWYNQQWLRRLPLEEVVSAFKSWAKTYESHQLKATYLADPKLPQIINILREKARTFAEFAGEMAVFYQYQSPPLDLLANPKMKVDPGIAKLVISKVIELLENLDETKFNRETIREKSIEKIGELDLKNGQFLWPFRAAISGAEKSPSPFEIVEILGKEASLKRLKSVEFKK